LFNSFVRGIYEGLFCFIPFLFSFIIPHGLSVSYYILDDFEFELDEAGIVVTKKYKGPWFIVHNRDLKWSTTVPPFKTASNEKERIWSHWLESLQKML
jgi:hypothetical protein